MGEFVNFDARHYPTVSVREGYGRWLPTYEETVEDLMDLALLERVATVEWERAGRVADLGCGTGRTAAWLRSRGATVVDGVDTTPEMLARARERKVHDRLVESDVRASGLPAGDYDVVVCSLVDEHLPELYGLYAEARRLLGTVGSFVVVGYHPFFIMAAGMPTHFDSEDGPLAIETYVHLASDHMAAAHHANFAAVELYEGVIDDTWIERKPKWSGYRGWPISFAWVWKLGAATAWRCHPSRATTEPSLGMTSTVVYRVGYKPSRYTMVGRQLAASRLDASVNERSAFRRE